MFGNQSDKNTNQQNNNRNTTPFGGSNVGGLFGSSSTPLSTGGLFGNPSAPPATGGLFGNPSVPTASGGLFNSMTPNSNSLFSNANTSTLNTSQRKQGGLFGSLKPTKIQQAPKLLFGSIPSSTNNTQLFGSNPKQMGDKKQENKFTPSFLSSGGLSSLFGGNNANSTGNFLSNSTPKDPTSSNVESKVQVPKTQGLFGSITENKTSSGLFSKKQINSSEQPSKQNKQNTLFGNSTQNSLFANKIQTPSFLDSNTQNSLFPDKNAKKQPTKPFTSTTTPSFFQTNTNNEAKTTNKSDNESKKPDQKMQIQKKTQSILFNSNLNNSLNKTPNTPLFGAHTISQSGKMLQVPKFSLTGNLQTKPNQATGPLFESTTQQKAQQNKNALPEPRQIKNQPNKVGSLLANTSSSQPNNVATMNTGSPFPGGLSNPKTQTKSFDSTFISKIADSGQINVKLKSNPLFGNLQPKQAPKMDSKGLSQTPASSSEVKAPQGLLATFSAEVQGQGPSKLAHRQARTISFNQSHQTNQNIESKPQSSISQKPVTHSLLFNQTQSKSVNQKPHQSSIKPSMTQSTIIRPSIDQSKIDQSRTERSKMAQQSFFKLQNTEKTSKEQTILTAFQINKLIREKVRRQSLTSEGRNSGDKLPKQVLKSIQEWISVSFSRFNQVPTSEVKDKRYTLHSNQDINRFLNDVAKQVILLVNLPFQQKSFRLVNKLFDELLDKLGIKQYLFNCTKIQASSNSTKGHAPNLPSGQAPCLQIIQLNTSYFLKHKIYKFSPEVIQLNLDSQELQHYIVALTKKFITNQMEYLEYLQNKPQLLKLPFHLFYQMLKYCLNYKKLRFSSLSGWIQKNPELVTLVQDFEKKIIRKVVSMLSGFLNQNFYSFLLLNKQYLAELIGLVENFSYNQEEDIVDLSLKVILNNIELGLPVNSSNKLDVNLSPQIRISIKDTKSVALLPFRTLLSILENSSNRLTPSSHDLYRYINGPEWLDWLEIYLSSGNVSNQKQVPIAQARYLIKILRYPSLNNKTIDRERLSPKESKYIQNLQKKILSRKRPIYKFIIALKQENMLNIFYEILMSLIYDYESYRRIEELFFKQKDEFNYEFRNVIAEISNYPTQKFKEEIPFMQEKVLYFLRVIQVAPERTLLLQKLIFQPSTFLTKKQAAKGYNNLGTQFKDNSDYSEVGHKICHFLIDGINYFGLKNNQLIVAKCISAIKSLLLNAETSLAMKIAMAVNKPDMVFISSSLKASGQPRLIQSLISQMTELLQYFLVSQEFVKTIAVNMRTNNLDNANLERMYAVRYSDKDYLPFVKDLINAQFLQAVDQNQVSSTENVILTFSTFWILKTLQVLVQALKQQTVSSSSNDRKFLHLLNLILQKFFIPLSNRIQEEDLRNSMIQETRERSNNPIYATSTQNLIPKVLLYMVEALNTVDIVYILGQNLKYRLLRSGHVFDSKTLSKKINYYLSNQKLEEDFASNENSVFLSLKILKQLLHTYRLYEQYKNAPAKQGALSSRSGQNHFMYKVLTRLKWIQDLQFSLFLKSYTRTDIVQSGHQSTNSKTNILIGLIALLLVDNKNERGSQNLLNQTQQSRPINLKQQNYEKPFIIPIESGTQINKKPAGQLASFSVVQSFYSKFGQTLNYQAINNFLIVSSNRYLESYESLQCLAIECLSLMISGEAVFGQRSCSHFLQSSINIAKYAGFYNVIAISQTPNEVFSNQWLLQSLQVQLLSLLCERQSTIQTKRAILGFMCQALICHKGNSNFMIAKNIFYKYLVRHLNQFQIYSEEQMVSLNLKVIKMLNTLYQKDNSYFSQQVSNRLLDTLMSKIVATCSKCLKSSQNLIKLVRSFQSKQYYETDLAYYHLERTVEERQIIKTGEACELLKKTIELVQKKFFDSVKKQVFENGHKWKCIRKINALVINLNLQYLTSTIIDQNISKSHLREIVLNQSTSKVLINTNLPRYFSKVPLQFYLSTARNVSDVYSAFEIYKTNIIDWLSFYSIGLGQKALHFLNWVLTVDRNLYGNQPITLKSRQFYENNSSNIICSLHMGNYKHSAVQLFADSQNEAINLAKNLYDDSVHSLQKGMTVNQAKCFSIMGYCLEWLRARQNTRHILQHLVKYTVKNTFWLDQKTLQNRSVIKFVLSLVSIGGEFLGNSEFKNIRQPILNLIHKFKQGKSQLEQTMIQELISVMICIPPQIEDSRGLNEILTLWKSQTNNEFFYNQSRMVLQICSRCSNQVAKLKALSSCDRIKKSISGANYSYSLRNPDSICLIWGLKIASTLMSSQVDTVVIFEEISQYYALNSQLFFNILLKTPSTITLGYIQELQALLQFFLTLISSKEWLIVRRKQFQKLTYILSHKLINMFTDFINSKINFSAQSDMQKRFKKLRFESLVDQNNEQNQNFNSINQIITDKDSVFRMLMDLKMIECMKTFTVLLSHSLEESWYVHKYFNQQVYENYRYGVSFWDRMNKSIMDMIRFNVVTHKKWKKCQNLNQKLNLINDCINSSEYFVETGYLSSLYSVASTKKQLFAEVHSLNLSSFELGTVHLIQQKGFRQKYQCLMKGNIQKYGKRLQQNIKALQSQFQSEDINSWNSVSVSIKPASFSDMLRNIAHLMKTI